MNLPTLHSDNGRVDRETDPAGTAGLAFFWAGVSPRREGKKGTLETQEWPGTSVDGDTSEVSGAPAWKALTPIVRHACFGIPSNDRTLAWGNPHVDPFPVQSSVFDVQRSMFVFHPLAQRTQESPRRTQ